MLDEDLNWTWRNHFSKEFCFDNGDGDLDDPVAGVDAQADDGGPQCHARHTFGQARLGNGHQLTHFG